MMHIIVYGIKFHAYNVLCILQAHKFAYSLLYLLFLVIAWQIYRGGAQWFDVCIPFTCCSIFYNIERIVIFNASCKHIITLRYMKTIRACSSNLCFILYKKLSNQQTLYPLEFRMPLYKCSQISCARRRSPIKVQMSRISLHYATRKTAACYRDLDLLYWFTLWGAQIFCGYFIVKGGIKCVLFLLGDQIMLLKLFVHFGVNNGITQKFFAQTSSQEIQHIIKIKLLLK